MNQNRNKWDVFFQKLGESFRKKQGEAMDLRVYQRIKHRKKRILLCIEAVLLLAGALAAMLHVAQTYQKLGDGWTDVNGTIFEPFGKNLLKYSPDGASCISKKGEVLWSTTYSMQTPVADFCGTTAAVAEQQGTQVFVFNADGLMGQFDTTLPILKVKVAKQGVVAVVLQDSNVTWINFYEPDGTQIAENRTTINDSGYPMDISLSPDGLKIMVSYLMATQGNLSTKVAFYNFDSVGQAQINNLVSSENFENTVVPEVFFTDSGTAVAVHNGGFSVYRGSQIPELKVEKTFEEEILSTFHDNSHIGFVFASEKENYKYRMEIYDLNGRRTMRKYLTDVYSGIRIQDDEVILYDQKKFQIYTTSGRKTASIVYEKAISEVVKAGSFGTYLVAGNDSTDLIRIW